MCISWCIFFCVVFFLRLFLDAHLSSWCLFLRIFIVVDFPRAFCTLEHHSNASSRNSYSSIIIIIIPLIITITIIIITIPVITIIIIIIIIPLMLNIQFKRLLIKENIWPVKNPSVSNSKWWVPRWKFNRETVIDRLQARQASFILQTFNNLKQFFLKGKRNFEMLTLQ